MYAAQTNLYKGYRSQGKKKPPNVHISTANSLTQCLYVTVFSLYAHFSYPYPQDSTQLTC